MPRALKVARLRQKESSTDAAVILPAYSKSRTRLRQKENRKVAAIILPAYFAANRGGNHLTQTRVNLQLQIYPAVQIVKDYTRRKIANHIAKNGHKSPK